MSCTVLVVDDNQAVLRVTAEMLVAAGYEVLLASSAFDALALAGSCETIDVLVADLVMPDLDAFDLAELLADRFPALRAVCMSGWSDGRLLDLFLAKPFTAEQLLAAIAACRERS
jgi:CheY-like chemotaxis protein